MLLFALALPILLLHAASAVRFTARSPCADVCGGMMANTTGDEIVCHDNEFNDTPKGRRFRDCVSCELQSTFYDVFHDESDVKWGLHNLRYAFSTCIYGYPKVLQSLSTPCQVTCQGLSESLKYKQTEPLGRNIYDFCGISTFSDKDITDCTICYSLTENEKFLANFLEAVREGCRARVPAGDKFFIEPNRIFNKLMLPANQDPQLPGTNTGRSKKNLILVIVLPIVGFLLFGTALAVGCFFYIRNRRRRARRESQSSSLHERWNDTSIMTPSHNGLHKYWGGEQTHQAQHPYDPNMAQSYDNSYYAPDQRDVKYPSEAHMMTSLAPQTTQHATDGDRKVPILSAAPPPRKSLTNNR
ncbi:hypothetical protein MGYG_08411 [Nannizzia gypsea CBS 118893]|uniref:Uncharacterized protein n=1 Tax=Arthroderma gypseum (strain ATCC MYA-4604 / CBS 118893) TaxID=535722 RepID=E4V5M4_ARTGP|nr:hypothetical protein MGYG_08411 [Nannizzia gypsea CBS 118893]EFR05399.1 hypothetical protein MGYG_08411 [Nannizzia gypsea CBS 118893]